MQTAARQILYVSLSTVSGDGADLSGILNQSRHNNALEGITGLLWSDGLHFMQVFEGPDEGVGLTFERIRRDSRHYDLRVISDCHIAHREFGDWTMIHRRATDPVDQYDARIRRLLASTTDTVARAFLGLIADGKAEGPISSS
jgi:hypothetical protein